jgi:hypothetical protein
MWTIAMKKHTKKNNESESICSDVGGRGVVFVERFGFNSGRIANNFDDFVLLIFSETINVIQTNIQNGTGERRR